MTRAAGLRVLLVEDDEDNRELMAALMEVVGHSVTSAATGREALDRIALGGLDVVVTDVGLPGMGGLEIARASKRAAPTVPVLLVTGYADRDDIANAARARDVDAVLVKPIDPDELTGALARVTVQG